LRQDRNVTSAIPARTAVLLPGTGSDEVFVRAVFGDPLSGIGVRLVTPGIPRDAELAEGYLAALDAVAAETDTPIVVGGISFGAHLAAEWAVAHPGRCAGLLAALPAWNSSPGSAPASLAATLSADLVARDGLEAALAGSVADVPPWLAEELSRAWRRHGDGLAGRLRAAARRPAPSLAALSGLRVPAGVATCVDDPIHPTKVAHEWASALPMSSIGETTLTALGTDFASLGRATVLAWLRAVRQNRLSGPFVVRKVH
jgi:pimeloyl-ACP methyl ester carboxylesterase